jgi:hypothetical protein
MILQDACDFPGNTGILHRLQPTKLYTLTRKSLSSLQFHIPFPNFGYFMFQFTSKFSKDNNSIICAATNSHTNA